MLNVLLSDTEYVKEYDRFVKSMSYKTEGHTHDFQSAVEAIRGLVKAVN